LYPKKYLIRVYIKGGRKMITNKSKGDKIFNAVNIFLMLLVIFVTLYPFWYVIIGSFNDGIDYGRGGVNFLVRKFTLANYQAVFRNDEILSGYKVTVARTILGTCLNLLVTSLFAYGFSRKNLKGKNFYAVMGLITMYFSGGLIPTYLLLQSMKLVNSFWVYIFPSLFSFFNVLIFQSFFREIPEAINESAKIDGAGEYRIYFSLIIPLSAPVFAAIALFVGVSHWNAFFDSLVYTTKPQLQTIQLVLMKIIQTKDQAANMANQSAIISDSMDNVTATTIQLATMMVTVAPILILYPFLQKYFVKGIMIGSVKG
jgi:putative aldouronate transport system permease protein